MEFWPKDQRPVARTADNVKTYAVWETTESGVKSKGSLFRAMPLTEPLFGARSRSRAALPMFG